MWAAISKAPAPGTRLLSTTRLNTARSPSRMASLICRIVWSLGPVMRMVQETAFLQPSTKVYLSSPRVLSYTVLARPRHSIEHSSRELMAKPPTDLASLSIFLSLARLMPEIPSWASMSRDVGSIPFWLMTTKEASLFSPWQTSFLKAITCLTLSSVNFLSAATILALSSAFFQYKPAVFSDRSYSRDTFRIRIKTLSIL
mmetsp:Transcript_29241/g.41035  ORF Transcript_29241/g.41035 Transcript_29241/m.41035 type:complete len:200 (-) Transcript_29241:704-1303(-)